MSTCLFFPFPLSSSSESTFILLMTLEWATLWCCWVPLPLCEFLIHYFTNHNVMSQIWMVPTFSIAQNLEAQVTGVVIATVIFGLWHFSPTLSWSGHFPEYHPRMYCYTPKFRRIAVFKVNILWYEGSLLLSPIVLALATYLHHGNFPFIYFLRFLYNWKTNAIVSVDYNFQGLFRILSGTK